MLLLGEKNRPRPSASGIKVRKPLTAEHKKRSTTTKEKERGNRIYPLGKGNRAPRNLNGTLATANALKLLFENNTA
jgi:hypothetical protein